MPQYKYLIIGGGMTAAAAVKGIRSVDASGTIGILCNEEDAPYKRPPLTKALWKGDSPESVWIVDVNDQATVHLARTATRIKPKERQVVDDQGDMYVFEKLLIATGGRVRTLPYDVEGIIYFRMLKDYRLLRAQTAGEKEIAVIGGGFIGSELAAALAMNRQKVSMIFPEDGIGARVYPPRLSSFLNEYYQKKGVTVYAKENIADIHRNESGYVIELSGNKSIAADIVVAGIGIQPNIELAQACGLEVDNGIVVSEALETSHNGIYAAGDVARFPNPALGKRIRVEHEDAANTMGEIAGRNMAGESDKYVQLPFFYSDLFDLGYEAVGMLDSGLEIVEDWKEEFREGVVYYLESGRVRGVLLWNTWGQVDAARALIAEEGPFNGTNLKGRLG